MRLGKKYVFLCKSVGIVCKKQLSLHPQKKHYSSLKQFDMKNLICIILLSCITAGLCPHLSAQDAVKLKTVRTDYGYIRGQSIKNMGLLDAATINPYALPNVVLLPVQVNLSNDTFPAGCALQQNYEVYFYSSDDKIIFSLGQNSQKNKLMEAIMPGDTCHLSMLSMDMFSIKAYLESNSVKWEDIAYWKLITGFRYSDKEGDYPAKKYYAGADTVVFRVLTDGSAAQQAVKLKTVRTEYGVHKNSTFNAIGNLDGAVINPDSVPTLFTHMYIVNTSNDTFKGTDKFRQVMIFYAYSEKDELLIEPDIEESNTYPFVGDLLPGDTTQYGTMGFIFSEMRKYFGEEIWNQISYWKIVTGISYTSVDGTYPDEVLFAGADTCTFRISTSGVSVVSVTDDETGCEVFPNPATSQIRLRVAHGTLQSLRVFNAVGQEVLRQGLEGNEQTINISTLANGIYFLQIRTGHGTVMRKIVVE